MSLIAVTIIWCATNTPNNGHNQILPYTKVLEKLNEQGKKETWAQKDKEYPKPILRGKCVEGHC